MNSFDLTENVVDSLVEVRLQEEDDFLKVRETLTRIGIASPKEKKLYQSCHILHKRGKYYIVHFKELFALDGKGTNFSEEDKGRRNTIVKLLGDWNLVDIVDNDKMADPQAPINHIKIISYRDKEDWELVTKYNIGKKY
jgi:hypothetical protein